MTRICAHPDASPARRNLIFYASIARRKGIKPATFYNRVRRGWTYRDACTKPARLRFVDFPGEYA